ncbi:bifunctional 3-(3-hydroxy-phenyl)propionate/3-hydroxycinnamic acid hydroxylase [Granulicoccus phenolivorans]|uniref:bifunctional 3-(3-hydroxy-phenyl)propionate/3-hydroxycinnamic acid hydroxylase n=1 Tax=Granulicoccus phenolivorans TaxID=266854 RepID=UPI000412FCE7|nr:bifunctional 3-(3-hydroxy-phenyl)propionate/3-hydroxycinnamic acid hydroxylase [Granulicoccus phenolivorans]
MTAPQTSDTDVIIVGMGPVGITLAGLLAKRNIRVAIFDKLPGLYPLPRAAGMDHEVMRIAQELGLSEELSQYVAPYRPSQYRGARGQVIKRLDSPPPPYRLGWDPMLVFDQPAFEGVVRDHVSRMPTVSASVNTDVVAFGQDSDGVWADLTRSGGPAERVRGRYLVACDGGGSPVRRRLGISMTDLGFHENWLVVDAIVEDDATLARLPETQVQYCEPTRPATFINLVGRRRRWEIALDPGELPVGPVATEDVWAWLERWIAPGEARIERAAAYMFHGLVADRWRQGRILLAGDAAHMTPPFMAQGMAQGMRDAQNLAWKLEAVLDGSSPDDLLDSYQVERRPHVIETTQHTIALGRMICERDEAAAAARDAQLVGTDGAEVPVTFRSVFLPPLTEGLIAETPGAGEIMPQPFVYADGEVRLLDDIIGSGFLVVVSPAVDSADLARLKQPTEDLRGRLLRIHPPADHGAVTDSTAVVERDGLMTAWLESLGATIVIARPDHYVYATTSSPEEAVTLLRRLYAALRTPAADCRSDRSPHKN